MDYREIDPPGSLRPLVKLGWTLSLPDDGPKWTVHCATPDGCMEIIRRLNGRSQWNGEQPETFVAGTITRPTALRLSAGSRFVALRVWPWAWRAITGRSPGELADRWVPLATAAPGFSFPRTVEAAFDALAACRVTKTMQSINCALTSARTPAELSQQMGLSPRTLQRWFETHVGQPPRTYLRMIRFSDAFAELPAADGGLAGHAADHGFADQAHMSREFRTLAGAPASRAKALGRGPFIEGR